MPEQEPITIRNFLNGVIRQNEVDDFFTPKGAVTDALNVHFDRKGVAKLRDGITLLGSQISSGNPILGLYNFISSNSSYNQILTVVSDGTNNDVYYLSGSTWTKKLEDDTKDLKTRFTTYMDKVVRVNGTEIAKAWDGNVSNSWGQHAGTSKDDLNLDDMDSYKGNLIETFKSKVYMAGNSTYPYRLWYSSDPTGTFPNLYITWTPTSDYIDFRQDPSPTITAIKRFVTELLVFKRDYLYRWKGVSGTEADPFIQVGTPSQESVVEAKDGIYFYHPPGIYRYSGDYPREISRPVSDFIDNIPLSYQDDVSAWCDGDHVMFSVGNVTIDGESFTNIVLRYTISSRIWTIYSYGTEIRIGCEYNNGTTITRVVGDDDGNVLTFDSGTTDNTSAIPYRLTTRWYELNTPSYRKVIRIITALCEKAQMSKLSYQIDDDTSWKTLGQLRKYVTYFKNKNIKCHRIRFRLYGLSKISPFIFQGMELHDVVNEGLIE